jgi:hypothetical protein
MSTFVKSFAAVVLFAAALAVTPGAAQAQHWHHHPGWHHYGWGFGFGPPYFYDPPEFYPPPCHWVRVRFWRHGHWHWRNERRCDY